MSRPGFAGYQRRFARLAVLVALASLLTILLSLASTLSPVAAQEAFLIKNYKIHMVVGDDNSYHITEDLDLDLSDAHHSLMRVLPRFTDNGVEVELSDLDCNAPFTTDVSGSDLQIRIGDPNNHVDGHVHYRISYLYNIGRDDMDDKDEVYFDLVGTQWDTDVENVEFEVDLQHPVLWKELDLI